MDPLVRVEIFGVRPDKSRQETSYVENNGEAGLGGAGLCWAGVRGVVVELGGRNMAVSLPHCPP